MENNTEKVDLAHVDWRSSRDFFDSLGDALDKLDDKDESYNFTWVGKRKSIIEAGTPINKTLRPDTDASKDFNNTKNMLIVGDNLDALKLLQESYLGKIKMIYIDPPYNTGRDFIYHDNFTVKKEDYIDDSVNKDGDKVIAEDHLRENSKSNGRFHSDWLSMMYPRLKLARNLLADDGAIFISIDDNEQANLKKLCDEVFGEDNFEGVLIWKTKTAAKGVPTANMLVTNHDYILVYSRSKKFRFSGEERDISKFNNPDNDPRGPWKGDNMKSTTSSNYFTITDPNTGNKYTKNWAFSQNSIEKMIAEDRILWPIDPNGTPRQKRFLSEMTNDAKPLRTLIGEFQSETATNKLKELFDDIKVFDFSKHLDLMSLLIKQASGGNDIVLDFFAGSGTTGHAIFELNSVDKNKRRFILCQKDSATDNTDVAKKAGYDTIDQITAERLRRAGDKIANENPDKKLDTGFRVFHIDSSNESEDIRRPLGQSNQLALSYTIDNIKKDRTPLDLLFGIVYASALPFDLKLETRKMGDNTVYLYGYLDEETGLVACFDNEVPEATVKEIAELKPLTAAFRDSSFKDSAEKINLSEHFRVISPNTKVKVI